MNKWKLCCRVSDINEKEVVPGSIIKKCDLCQEDIWSNPRSDVVPDHDYVCNQCLADAYKRAEAKHGPQPEPVFIFNPNVFNPN